jgi:DNA-binding transcriptional regulator YiaG
MRRVTYDYKARLLAQPPPDQVKAARQACRLTQSAAAALVHRHDSSRWREWERDGPSGRVIDLAIWELFLIKSGLRVNT